MKSLAITLTAFLFALLTGQMNRALAQKDVENILKVRFNQYREVSLQEKIFIHTDKEVYLGNEIIWFKVYATDAHLHEPLDLSKVVYVEILDNGNKPYYQTAISMKNATGEGSIQLTGSIPSGNYMLRAYTNWMKNNDPGFYFQKLITIYNPLKRMTNTRLTDSIGLQLGFFPEGGELIAGIPVRVAFKVVNQDGLGEQASGILVNQRKDTVARLETFRFGMGSFSFEPKTGDIYQAILRSGDGRLITKQLPPALSEGYSLRLEDIGGTEHSIKVTVTSKGKDPSEQLCLLVHARQTNLLIRSAQMIEGKVGFIINKNLIGEGVAHFTVFSAKGLPVAERLYCKRPANLPVISLTTGKPSFGSRDSIEIEYSIKNSGKDEAPIGLSFSVYEEDALHDKPIHDIISYLYLSSDIKGFIESPGYYFFSSPGDAEKALDNLMLTQGWRRFKWKDILEERKAIPMYLPEVDGHILLGRIRDSQTQLPLEGRQVFMIVPGKAFQISRAVSNANGELKFDLPLFYGSTEIVVQPDSIRPAATAVDLVSVYSDQFSNCTVPPLEPQAAVAGDLSHRFIGSQVQQRFHSENAAKFNLPLGYDSTSFFGIPDKTYFLDDYTRFRTMEEVFREFITEVKIRKQQAGFKYTVLNAAYSKFFEDDPLVLLDGVPILDPSTTMNLDPLSIQRIDIVGKQYVLGTAVFDGIISLRSYEGNRYNQALLPSGLLVEYPGLQLEREFYTPVYDNAEAFSSRIPDQRSLLLWSTFANSPTNGKLTCYSSDRKGKFRIVVQGLTNIGRPLFNTSIIEIR